MSNIKIIEAALEAGCFDEAQAAAAEQEIQSRLGKKQINTEIPLNAKFGAIHCVILDVLHSLKWQSDRNFFMIAEAVGVVFDGEVPYGKSVFIEAPVAAAPAVNAIPSSFSNEDWDENDDDDYIDD